MEKVKTQTGYWQKIKQMLTIETGQRYEKAYGEMQQGIECMKFTLGDPILMTGDQLPYAAVDAQAEANRHPVGVIGGICYL